MKSEGIGVLLFILLVIGIMVIGVSEDYSRNAGIKEAQEQQEREKIARNQERIDQFRAEESIHALGCATLDCAIEKSMKERR